MVIGDEQARNTILAALRFYQEKGQGDPFNRSEAIHELATNGDEEVSLDDEGIDELCQLINHAPTHSQVLNQLEHIVALGQQPDMEWQSFAQAIKDSDQIVKNAKGEAQQVIE